MTIQYLIKYCKNCTIPETRPNTEIGTDDGLCAGCKYYYNRENINWCKRKAQLLETIKFHKKKITVTTIA